MDDPQPAISCRALTKDYGHGHGVFDLDLAVERGIVYGFIGPNGAGKTTTIRLLMDLIRADRGSARILGLDCRRDSLAIKRLVGYLPGELPQFPGMKAGQVIGLLAGLRGSVDPDHVSRLAHRLQLDLARRYQELSLGNKQKVLLVQAFMHRPRLLILDEPTLGLDPLMQREVRALIREAVDDQATVLLSSHVLPEVELACDQIGLIREGRIVRSGTLAELRSLRIHEVEAILAAAVSIDELAALPGVSDATITGSTVRFRIRGDIGPVLNWLSGRGAVELDSRELSLEEVFLSAFEPTP